MIDVHCHLEQIDYQGDRDKVIEKCKRELQAIITSCAHPRNFDLTMKIIEKHNGFAYATIGLHPLYIREIDEREIYSFLDQVKKNRDKIVGIGEVGLDYHWIMDDEWREKQREQFVELIRFSKELKLPLVVHSWDADEDAIKIIEKEDPKRVLMHMFESNSQTRRVIDNGWFISTNAIILKSKKRKKVVRDAPLERLLLETDSPWLAPEGFGAKRNDPTSVKFVAEKIAEIKKISVEEVDRITTENSKKFFNLDQNPGKAIMRASYSLEPSSY